MKKITSEDCISEIDKRLPGRKWKRLSKKVVVERVFADIEQPGLQFLVREEGGKLTVLRQRVSGVRDEWQHKDLKPLNEVPYYFFEAEDAEAEPEDGHFFPCFYVVPKDFWDKHRHLDDGVNCTNVKMPPGFTECMEACFEFNGTKEKAVEKLLAAGFISLPEEQEP